MTEKKPVYATPEDTLGDDDKPVGEATTDRGAARVLRRHWWHVTGIPSAPEKVICGHDLTGRNAYFRA